MPEAGYTRRVRRLLLSFVRRRVRFEAIERWQTGYLPVYAAWAWVVVLAFPPLFNFR